MRSAPPPNQRLVVVRKRVFMWTAGTCGLAMCATRLIPVAKKRGSSSAPWMVAANSGGINTTETLAGIGDDAVLGPLDTVLIFVKGDIGVSIGLATVPNAREKGIAMARTIAGRL